MSARGLVATLAVLAWGVGALAADGPGVPVTVAQYQPAVPGGRPSFPPYVVRLYNLRRVLDGELGGAERAESMRLASQLGAWEPATLDAMASLLSDAKTPADLQALVLGELLKSHRPGLSAHAIRALPAVPPGGELRRTILEWLADHGDLSMFPEVVKAWAEEPPDGADEARYRRTVEKLSKVPWDEALLVAMNAESFFARGSAMKVLAGRGTAAAWRDRIARLSPRTEAMAALKACVVHLDYLPEDGLALLSAVTVHRARPEAFGDVSRLARQWQLDGGYQFSMRDFHLLSRLAADPLRQVLRRRELLAALREAVTSRPHVPRHAAPGSTDQLEAQADRLTPADLWNLYLLEEMLRRPRVLLALRVMAGRDRADATTAWGGLVVYESGQAEARLYPPEPGAPTDDRRHVPSRQMMSDGRDALCRFQAHFEKADNADRAGPTAQELQDARDGNYYGLIVTSVSETEFCAHYLNPQGVVVSLGRMAYRF